MRRFWKGMLLLLLVFSLSLQARAADLSVERKVYDYLTEELGLPSAAACGVLANMEEESGFRVGALGDSGSSFGLCQWHADRYENLKTYCLGRGLDYRTVEGQLDYLSFELRTTYSGLLGALRTVSDDPDGAYRAAYLWCVQFERPANMEERATTRGILAKGKYWNRYNAAFMVQQPEITVTVEEVEREILDTKVTVPEPPRRADTERYYPEEEESVLPLTPYIPRHRPQVQEDDRPDTIPALGYAAAVLFAPLINEKKERFVLKEPQEAVSTA